MILDYPGEPDGTTTVLTRELQEGQSQQKRQCDKKQMGIKWP